MNENYPGKWCRPAFIVAAVLLAPAGCVSRAPVAPVTRYEVRAACSEMPDCFETLQAAVDASGHAEASEWVEIEVAAGDYNEKVTIRRPKVRIVGAGQDRVRIHFDAVAEYAGQYHRAGWGTPGSATLTIDADEVTVEGVTVENTFDYLSNDALPSDDAGKLSNPQAAALLLDIHSDRVFLKNVALLGYQDTVFANGRRVLIRNSFISGNVDFIFGNGEVLIEDSTVESRRRGAASANEEEFQSFITAPSTPLSQPVGIVIYRSRLTREEGVPDASVALGRPWHPTTRFPDGRYADPLAIGQASFIDCYMDSHIHPDHWASMPGTARDGTKTDIFLPQDSRFFESGSHGPGARHQDIGIKWDAPLGIDEVHAYFFRDWQDPAQ